MNWFFQDRWSVADILAIVVGLWMWEHHGWLSFYGFGIGFATFIVVSIVLWFIEVSNR